MPPEEFYPKIGAKPLIQIKNRLGCLIVGAENINPQLVRDLEIVICYFFLHSQRPVSGLVLLQITKNYAGLFNASGIMPKRLLRRFIISPQAALQPGTPLYASHFKPGDFVDIRGKT